MENAVLQHFKNAVSYLIAEKKAKSKKDIASVLGLSPSYFSELLNNRINLSADHIQKFCSEYNVSPLYIFGKSAEIFDNTPDHTYDNRGHYASDLERSPILKRPFVSPTLSKSVSPTVSPTHENCKICEEKERIIHSMQNTIDAQNDSIRAMKKLLEYLNQEHDSSKKQAG